MTDIQKVQLLIGDVAGAQFTVAQIQAFLDMAGGSVNIAAALALEAWAATLTDNAVSEKIGDYAYSKKAADNKLALAERYRKAEAETPVLTWAEMNLTGTDIEVEDE